jgi:hypothetical protein
MKKLLAFIFPLLLAAGSAHASLFWYEGFQYPNGSLAATNTSAIAASNSVSGGLWVRESGTAFPRSDMYVVNSNLQVTATGGTYISRQDDCDRLFYTNGAPAVNTNPPVLLYASFTVICSTTISNNAGLPNLAGTYFASFYSTNKGYAGLISAFTSNTIVPNTWRMAVSGSSAAAGAPSGGGFPVDLAVNTPYQVVEELDPITLQAATIWINPVDLTDTGSTGSDPKYTSSDSLKFELTNTVNSYAFRQPSSFGSAAFIITNLAIATTFPEAATNVWPTNATAPVIVYQPVGVTNFVGATFSLSAVANGQGLASMTYQWYQNGGPLAGEATPNNNILNFSSASVADTGNYTLVATTPLGLSVTSSVAKVSISAAPVPPSFITQPVTQTAYSGATVVLSTSVSSPGNVTFTWYSNNVVVSAGQNDSGDSSSYEIDNVTTNSSATYKVAVTNDVVANGVVSTNAILTVIAPPQVSIAYLRTLVDPNNNYVATNSVLPYSVTGVITTTTNLTSGNTASYYLQDATAGINIFATFGSTFRPALGDVVTFVGVMSSFSSGLELDADLNPSGSTLPYTSATDTGTTAPLPTPVSIPFTYTNNNYAFVNTNLAGRRVQLSDVYFGANAGNIITNGFLAVTNSLGQTAYLWFSAQDTNTLGNILPSHAATVTGVLFGSMNSGNPNFAVAVTSYADIVTNSPSPTSIAVSVTRSGNDVSLGWVPTPAGSYSYTVQRTAALGSTWSTLLSGTTSTNYTDSGATATAPVGFYRVTSP